MIKVLRRPIESTEITALDVVIVGTRPTGSELKWEGDVEFLPVLGPDPGDGVRLLARSGGVKTVVCSLVDEAGSVLTSAKATLSVPILVGWAGMSLTHYLQNALDAIKLGDRLEEITARIRAIVAELLPGMNLRIFPGPVELVADMYRVDVALSEKTEDHPHSLVIEPFSNTAGTLGGRVKIGLDAFAEHPVGGPAYTALADALKSATAPSASLKTFMEEFLARTIARTAAYGVLRALGPTSTAMEVTSLAALTGYSLPDGVTASKKPSDYTDQTLAAMKLPDEWLKNVKKRLPIPPDFV